MLPLFLDTINLFILLVKSNRVLVAGRIRELGEI